MSLDDKLSDRFARRFEEFADSEGMVRIEASYVNTLLRQCESAGENTGVMNAYDALVPYLSSAGMKVAEALLKAERARMLAEFK